MAKDDYDGPVMVEYEEPKPHMDLNTKSLPALKDWQVGKDYYVVCKVHMKSKSQGGYKKPDNYFSGCFDVMDVKPYSSK